MARLTLERGLARGVDINELTLDASYGVLLQKLAESIPLALPMLSVLARSRDRGFTGPQVAALLQADPSEVDRAVEACRIFLVGQRHLRPHHRCLTEYLGSLDDHGGAEVDWLSPSAW